MSLVWLLKDLEVHYKAALENTNASINLSFMYRETLTIKKEKYVNFIKSLRTKKVISLLSGFSFYQ